MSEDPRVALHCESVRPNQFEAIVALVERHRTESGAFGAVSPRGALGELLRDPLIARVWFVMDGREAIGYVVMTIGCSLASGGRHAILDTLYLIPERRSGDAFAQVVDAVANAASGLRVGRLYHAIDETEGGAAPFFARVPHRTL